MAQKALVHKKRYYFNRIKPGTNIVLNLVFLIYTLICLAPMLLVIMISFTDEKALRDYGYSLFPKQFSTYAYTYIVSSAKIMFRAYGNSIFVTLVGTVVSLLVISMYAYPLSRNGFKYKNLFSFLVYFTMIFGGGLVPWVIIYNKVFKINNTIWVLIFPYLISGWFVIIMRTFMKSTIPEEIIESARMDGASEFRIFFIIVLPLCKAGLATIGLFAMLNYWNDWYLPLIFINKPDLYTIQFLLYSMLQSLQFLRTQGSSFLPPSVAAHLPAESARMAVAVLAIGPIIFAYPFFQNYFIKGLTIGAVKG